MLIDGVGVIIPPESKLEAPCIGIAIPSESKLESSCVGVAIPSECRADSSSSRISLLLMTINKNVFSRIILGETFKCFLMIYITNCVWCK